MRSAKTAMTSKTSTMTAPNVPSGLRRAARARAELVPDARIEDGIERVHRQVDQDDGGDDDEVDALDDRIVALGDRLEEETPGHGQPEDGGAACEVVAERVLADRRKNADGQRDDHGEDDARGAELERHREPARQLLPHGPARPQRFAEVTADDVAEPFDVLDVERAVEAELGAQLGEVARVRLFLQHQADDIA